MKKTYILIKWSIILCLFTSPFGIVTGILSLIYEFKRRKANSKAI